MREAWSGTPGISTNSIVVSGLSIWLSMFSSAVMGRAAQAGELMVRSSIGTDWSGDAESRFLRSDEAERAPVEIGVAASDSGDEPVSHHVDRWHRGAGAFRF